MIFWLIVGPPLLLHLLWAFLPRGAAEQNASARMEDDFVAAVKSFDALFKATAGLVLSLISWALIEVACALVLTREWLAREPKPNIHVVPLSGDGALAPSKSNRQGEGEV